MEILPITTGSKPHEEHKLLGNRLKYKIRNVY